MPGPLLLFPTLLEAYQAKTGQRWSYLARLLGLQPETLWHWRRGHSLPWPGKTEQLAALLERPDLLHVVERDRMALSKYRAARRASDAAVSTTPRTLVIPASDHRDGAA